MAATSVLKLVLDDKEYSASIKEAKRGMVDLERALHDAGKSFSDVDKSIVEYAKEIGNMNTVAKESRTQLREMSQTLTDLTRIYRQLSDEEKSSEFGKGLLQSIDKLTERAGDIQDAMGDVQESIKHAASDTRLFDQISQGAQVLTAGFQGLTGAGQLLGVNMGDNVEVIAKLQSAMAVVNSLTTIQNALQKQSALMMGLSAVKAKLLAGNLTAAAVATKAMSIAMKGVGIGLAIAALTTIIDKLGIFSSSSDDAADASDRFNDSLEKMDSKVKELETSFQNLISYMQQIGASSNAIDDLRKEAADAEVALAVAEYNKLFNRGLGGVAGRALTALNQNAIPQSIQQQALDKITAARQRQGQVYAEIANRQKAGDFFNSNWNTLNTEKEINAAIGYFRNLRSEMEKGSAEYAEMTRRIDALQAKITTGGSGGGGGGSRGGVTSLAPQYSVAGLTEDLKYLQQEQQKATSPEEWRTYADAIRAVGDEIKKVNGELSSNGLDTTTGGISISGILSDKVRSDLASYRKQKIEVHDPVGEKEKVDTTQKVGELVSSVSSIVGSLNQLGIDVPKGFSNMLSGLQAVITILQAIQSIQYIGNLLGIFHNGGIVPHAASGYMVPGTHYSNDVTPILANAGELILSKSQQGNLAAQLSDTQGGYAAQPYVNGEMILLGTNNYLRRSGQGEIVTTKMLANR